MDDSEDDEGVVTEFDIRRLWAILEAVDEVPFAAETCDVFKCIMLLVLDWTLKCAACVALCVSLEYPFTSEEVLSLLLRPLSVEAILWKMLVRDGFFVSVEGVSVCGSPSELLDICPELGNIFFIDRLLDVALFCNVDWVTRKELEKFVSIKLDAFALYDGVMTLLLDDKLDSMLWFDSDSLVNNAKVRGSVNPAIENVEAPSNDRTLLGTLGVSVVVTKDIASVIGSVEPVTGKLEDWSMVRMPVLFWSKVGEDVLVLLTERRRLNEIIG